MVNRKTVGDLNLVEANEVSNSDRLLLWDTEAPAGTRTKAITLDVLREAINEGPVTVDDHIDAADPHLQYFNEGRLATYLGNTLLADRVGTRVYVSKVGSDSRDGLSTRTSVASLKRACQIAAALPSDRVTIYIASGNYYEENPIYVPKGTAIIGDNLRQTIIRPLNDGLDMLWVSSGCYVNYLVFRDNYGDPNNPADAGRGMGILDTGSARRVEANTTTFNLFPGHSLKRVPGIFKDGGGILSFTAASIVEEAYNRYLVTNPIFVPVGTGTTASLIAKCKRDIGFIIEAVANDLRTGGNINSILAGEAYRDSNGNIQFISGMVTQMVAILNNARNLSRIAITTVPNNYPDSVAPGDCSSVQAAIDTLFNIVISIIQGGDIPRKNPGPGYIQIDQEWCEVNDISGTVLTVVRGINDPTTLRRLPGTNTIVSDPSVQEPHVSGAVITQGGRTWRYAVTFPDQEGIRGKGRITIGGGANRVVTGTGTQFTQECFVQGKIKIEGVEYIISEITSNTNLVLDTGPGSPITIPSSYAAIPPRESIFLSPYTQNCSSISVLGRSFYNSSTRSYDVNRTRSGGVLVDGAQLTANSPIRSMVCDAFTQIVSGGVGFHHKNDGYSQLVSVFTVFEDVGIICESGSYTSVTNSATNFGKEGLKAVGFSSKSLPFFATGLVANINNVTKEGINPAPSSILTSSFAPESAGRTRVTFTVSTENISKFERGQLLSIIGHNTNASALTTLLNGSNIEVDNVQFGLNRVEVLLDIAYSASFRGAVNTGNITVTQGSVFTELEVTGFTATPPSSYIVKIYLSPNVEISRHPSNAEYTVAEVSAPLTGGVTTFSLQQVIPNTVLASIPQGARIELRAPSVVNSSGHTFEFVGSSVNYNGLPENGGRSLISAQNVEVDSGKCFVSATDQEGNFSVGPFFNVNLQTGKVAFSGSISVGSLEVLSLKNSPGVPIFKFSTDRQLGGPIGTADTIIPTQKAIRDFVVDNLGAFIGLNKGTNSQANLIVQLDSTGKISRDQLPPSEPFAVYTVANQAERLVSSINGTALRAGDIVIQLAPSPAQTFILRSLANGGGTNASNWTSLSTNVIDATSITSGIISSSRLGTGTANNSTYLNGTGQWTPISRGLRATPGSGIILEGDGGTVTDNGKIYRTGFVDVGVNRAAFSNGQTSGASSTGIASFAYEDFILENSVVSLRDRAVELSKIQDIPARTILGNVTSGNAPVQALVLGQDIPVIVTYDVSVVLNQFSINSSGLSLGTLPTLYLSRGQSYKFNILTSGHPFYFVEESAAVIPGQAPASRYQRGVVGDGTTNGPIYFNVPPDAPSVLFYQSGSTSANFGRIVILKEERTVYVFSNGNYAVPRDATDVFQIGNLSAPRTVSLPSAGSVENGKSILVIDNSGTCSASNSITVAPAAGNTINGSSSYVLTLPNQGVEFKKYGNNWVAVPGTYVQPSQTVDLNSSGSVPIPPWATQATIYVAGGGGGGGSGAKADTVASGGGGGAGASFVEARFSAAELRALGPSINAVVGGGGSGGPATTSSNLAGTIGGSGGNTVVSIGGSTIAFALGGTGGGGGRIGVNEPVTADIAYPAVGSGLIIGERSFAQVIGGVGGAITAVPTGTHIFNPPPANTGPAGGGGGGCLFNTGTSPQSGGVGGRGGFDKVGLDNVFYDVDPTTLPPDAITTPEDFTYYYYYNSGGTAGGIAPGGAGADGSVANSRIQFTTVGSGGGGGASSGTGAGGRGGNGFRGSGGGGGGASRNGLSRNSGAGGAGGNGWVRVVFE